MQIIPIIFHLLPYTDFDPLKLQKVNKELANIEEYAPVA